MKKITSWAAASAAIAILAACDVTVTDDNADGGTTSSSASSSTGTAGSGGSSTSTTTTGSGGTGGSGGSSSEGGTCELSVGASECEKCAFDKCMPEICACNGDADCKGALADYLMCVSSLDGGDMAGCAGDFTTSAASGAGKANDFATCMDDCQSRCQGHDGGQ